MNMSSGHVFVRKHVFFRALSGPSDTTDELGSRLKLQRQPGLDSDGNFAVRCTGWARAPSVFACDPVT